MAKEKVKTSSKQKNSLTTVSGIKISHPDKILYPDSGLTKLDLAEYFKKIAPFLLPELMDRPLSLVRCPSGRSSKCFFQKHPGLSLPKNITSIKIKEEDKEALYLVIKKETDLIELSQMNVLELHCWGAKSPNLEKPDRLVFDLDPGPNVAVKNIVDCAFLLKEVLEGLKLTPYVKSTGGKGLHIVVPLKQKASWTKTKSFAKKVSSLIVSEDPHLYVATSTKSKREGKIFIDYLRNGRGSTYITNYSPRARSGAPVSTPLSWDELNNKMSFSKYTVKNIFKRLKKGFKDPWEGIEENAGSL